MTAANDPNNPRTGPEPPNLMHSSTLIAVDIGNNSTKLGQFDALRCDVLKDSVDGPQRVTKIETSHLINGSLDAIQAWLPTGPCRWVVASVHRPAEEGLAKWVSDWRGEAYHKLQASDLPLRVDLPHPDLVGMDRLAAAVGANAARPPNRPAMVVDSGTAITVDYINSEGVFAGGAILPGLSMAARALAAQTEALPEVDQTEVLRDRPAVVGKSTVEAIRSGLYWGVIGAVKEFRRQLAAWEPNENSAGGPKKFWAQKNFGPRDDLEVFATGGAIHFLGDQTDFPVRIDPHLVLQGIALADINIRSGENPAPRE